MKKLGDYVLGIKNMPVYTDKADSGGSFDGDIMVIGLDVEKWYDCVEIALHEAFEVSLVENRLRWNPSIQYTDSKDRFLFVMTHPEFSEVCAQVACFLVQMLPDLAKRWEKSK